MLNLGRNDRWVDVKDSAKSEAKPTVSNAMQQPNMPTSTVRPSQTPGATLRETTTRDMPSASAPTPAPAPVVAPSPEEKAGSKLFVGVNIKLKGVEISNCDVLVIEGQVDATVNSKVMEISKPGTLTGTAVIDVAEIHGEFSGELTARTKLVVHGTGRVTGTVRYGKLVVAEGGMLMGELKQIEAGSSEQRATASAKSSAPDTGPASAAQPAH
jgi:cytoskeletal protein CcmA (bactofilin family)